MRKGEEPQLLSGGARHLVSMAPSAHLAQALLGVTRLCMGPCFHVCPVRRAGLCLWDRLGRRRLHRCRAWPVVVLAIVL